MIIPQEVTNVSVRQISQANKNQIDETIPHEFFSKCDKIQNQDVVAIGLQNVIKISMSNFQHQNFVEISKIKLNNLEF